MEHQTYFQRHSSEIHGTEIHKSNKRTGSLIIQTIRNVPKRTIVDFQ